MANTSRVSKYYRMTSQLLLEYRCKQYEIISNSGSSDKQPETYYTYIGKDGQIYYTEEPRINEAGEKFTSNQSLYLKLPVNASQSYKYMGTGDNTDYKLVYSENPEQDTVLYKTKINQSVKNNLLADYGSETRHVFHYDTINLYLLRGFNLDELSGVSIKVKAKAKCYEIKKDSLGLEHNFIGESYVTLLDYYLDKEVFGSGIHTSNGTKSTVKYLNSPLYMNSKYYDRYVTVDFPSPYSISLFNHIYEPGIHNNDSYVIFLKDDDMIRPYIINKDSDFIIEFSTVSTNNVQTDGSFILDKVVDSAVQLDNNSDFFNACIYEDSDTNSIVYYPIYGDVYNSRPLDAGIMQQIETGAIPIVANAFYNPGSTEMDINDIDLGNIDELYYATGDSDAYLQKWKIYNDLYVQYKYRYNNELSGQYSEKTELTKYTESFSRLIDYTDTTGIEDYWKSRYVPFIRDIIGMTCTHITFKFTCRLVNVYRGVECIRMATLTVDARKYIKDISKYVNVNTYRIINKTEQKNVSIHTNEPVIKEKYIRSYYDVTNLVAKNMGENAEYPQGQMTLRLKHTNAIYRINLYNITEDNVRVPFDLTGPYKYKIVFPSINGNKIQIRPNVDTTNQNMGVGTLAFYITGEQVKQIMNVDASERYFAITTDVKNSSAQETTLYEGLVDWI